MVLVQSVLGGNASGSFTTLGGVTSCTGNFGSNTTAGNLLVLACYHNQHVTSGLGQSPAASSVSTSGITWSSSLLAVGFDASPNRQNVSFFAAANAPSLSSGTSTTFTITNSASSANGTETVEFALYEFSGISQVVNYTTGAGLINTKVTGFGTGTTPSSGNATTNKTCLIVAAYKGNSGNIAAGSGYNLGQTMTVATFGQFQYKLDVSAGVNATGFSGGTEANWGAGAIAFQAPATVPSNNSYGFFFG